jgi:hypothetical protein
MFDSTRIVLSAGKGQIGSWLRRSNHLTRTVDPRQRMRGFSVVELLTTVIILLVVSAMAVFQMQPMWQQIHYGYQYLDECESFIVSHVVSLSRHEKFEI